jgi:CheY-like chemotaxis protein
MVAVGGGHVLSKGHGRAGWASGDVDVVDKRVHDSETAVSAVEGMGHRGTRRDGEAGAGVGDGDDPGGPIEGHGDHETVAGGVVDGVVHGFGGAEHETLRRLGSWQPAPYQDAPRPDLVLLDLNLPRMDGRALLEVLKDDPTLRRVPVVVLTTSTAEEDVLRSYDLHANAYVTKPVELDQFANAVRLLEGFFITVARFPPV